MIPEFSGLQETEIELLYDSIPLITLLIGGADGELDQDEVQWSSKITKIRSYASHNSLAEFYKIIGERYDDRLKQLIADLPDSVADRNQEISGKLSKLNEIFPKMDEDFAYRLYKDLRTFAEHVAKASGGFLRFGNISKAEREWLDLPMVTPIEIE